MRHTTHTHAYRLVQRCQWSMLIECNNARVFSRHLCVWYISFQLLHCSCCCYHSFASILVNSIVCHYIWGFYERIIEQMIVLQVHVILFLHMLQIYASFFIFFFFAPLFALIVVVMDFVASIKMERSRCERCECSHR